MSTLVLTLDDRLARNLATLAERSRKPLPDWAAEQLGRLVERDAEGAVEDYSPAWKASFGSIEDASFMAPNRAQKRFQFSL